MDRLLEPDLTGPGGEGPGIGGTVGHGVVEGGEALQLADRPMSSTPWLMTRLLATSRSRPTRAIRPASDRVYSSRSGRRHRLLHQTDGGGLAAAHCVAGEQQSLGPLGAEVVEPHVGGGHAHRTDRREADPGIVGGHHDVAVEGQVGAAGQAVAVDLGDDRDGGSPTPWPSRPPARAWPTRRPRCRPTASSSPGSMSSGRIP